MRFELAGAVVAGLTTIAHAESKTANIFTITETQWNALNESVSGRLHTTLPIASPCYSQVHTANGSTQTGTYNFDQCSTVSQQKSNSSYIVGAPGGFVTYNFGTCQTTNAGCPIDLGNQLLGSCDRGSVSEYHIEVQTPDDVAAGLQFAQEHAINLVVKNTGHDYRGRSSAPGALSLWTHNVQPSIEYSDAFLPDGCSATEGPALTYGAGQGFLQIYETAHAHGMMAVGGTSPTVGASGGWVAGGGHSALSPTYGLGVDNVLQMRAVLPNGTYVTANRCQNTDLFFALRGGGGGTFAVVMETTAKVYPEVPLQQVSIIAASLGPGSVEAITRLLVENTPQWSADGWGGYMASGGLGVGAILIDMITPNLTLDEAKASMKPVTDYVNSLLPQLTVPITVNITTVPNYYAYYHSSLAQTLSKEGVGSSVAMASRLVPKASFHNATAREQLISTITQINTGRVPVGLLMVAPANYDLPATDQPGGPGYSSIVPAWRTSYWHTLFQSEWSQGDDTYGGFGSAFAVFNATTYAADPLRAITPPGCYQNEGDTYEPNAPANFWGDENYARLLALKRELDPGNVLTCHQCVGWNPEDDRYSCFPDVRGYDPTS